MRTIVGEEWRPARTDDFLGKDEVCRRAGVPTLTHRLRAERLRFAPRVSEGPAYLRAILATTAGAAWRSALQDDLLCMQMVLPAQLGGLHDPREHPAAWERIWRQYPGAWKSLVAKFLREVAASDPYMPCTPSQQPPAGQAFTCGDCGQVFLSRRALKNHSSAAHGYIRPAAMVSTGTVCTWCGNDYGPGVGCSTTWREVAEAAGMQLLPPSGLRHQVERPETLLRQHVSDVSVCLAFALLAGCVSEVCMSLIILSSAFESTKACVV